MEHKTEEELVGLFHIGYEDCRGQSRPDAQFRNK